MKYFYPTYRTGSLNGRMAGGVHHARSVEAASNVLLTPVSERDHAKKPLMWWARQGSNLDPPVMSRMLCR